LGWSLRYGVDSTRETLKMSLADYWCLPTLYLHDDWHCVKPARYYLPPTSYLPTYLPTVRIHDSE